MSVSFPVGPVTRNRKPGAPMQLKVALRGDQRVAENLILEVQELARVYGLECPTVEVVRRPSIGPKAKKPGAGRKPGSRFRAKSSA